MLPPRPQREIRTLLLPLEQNGNEFQVLHDPTDTLGISDLGASLLIGLFSCL